MLIKHTPVNFLRDENGIISGFTEEGDLVYICDGYGNYVAVQYDEAKKITAVFDSKKAIASFEYADGKLSSITDCRGRKVSYVYDEDKLNLTDIIYPDGSSLNFKYVASGLRTITYDSGEKAEIDYSNGKIKSIRLVGISGNQSRDISKVNFTFSDNEVTLENADGEAEEYTFNEEKRVIKSCKTSNTGAVTSEDITYDYTDGKKITTVKSGDLMVQNVTETEIYDDFDLLISKEVDWQRLSDTVRVKTLTEYTYDLSNRLIQTKKTEKKDGVDKTTVSVVKYGYNSQGSLVLTESYVEGEEQTSGVTFEERLYDENGNVAKTVSWNSLDSSTKFYSEKTYAENGQVVADKDELGEASAEYEYLSDTNLVKTKTLANGSKIAYGRNPYNDGITSVTQSTDDGEANTTDIVYERGLPVKVKSGNTVLEYEYDHKGRKTKVKVNGTLQSDYSYEDFKKDTNGNIKLSKQSHTVYENGAAIKSVYLHEGLLNADQKTCRTEKLTVGNDLFYLKKYNTKEQFTDVTYQNGVSGNTEVKYTYNAFGNLTKAETTFAGGSTQTESITYTPYGEVAGKTISGAVNHTYSYSYKQNAARDLDYISVSGYRFKPLKDLYGRNTGKEILNAQNNGKVAAEYISYKKVGDHGTNMPSTVWYASGKMVKDNIRYKYDNCGNIVEIIENNKLSVRYEYDKLNRLIKEDNKQLGKVFEFVYDTNGNILYKTTTANGATVTDEYLYEGDKLLSFNGESCEYNSLGNPTTYRDKTLSWGYGRFLTSYGGTNFKYDGLGRRVSKGTLAFRYDNDGNLIAQNNDLQFVYDATGVAGVILNGTKFFYRKDAQGNIIAILNETGNIVAKYIYDAWGNHAVVDNDGIDINDDTHIGNLNPFRYRGYYYDVDTGLYYLQTRYYDPETGRFISQDSTDYADPESINGLNLYAYCGNNPVMAVDPTGTKLEWWQKLLIGVAFIVVGAAVSALTAGAGTGFFAAFGAALLSSTIQVGISTAISAALGTVIGGISTGTWEGAVDGLLNGAVDGFMWGGIFAGGAQIVGAGFRTAANVGAQTGRKGGIELGKTGVKILSPDKNNWTKAGGTLIKFGKSLRVDIGAHWGLHLHILNSPHLPIGTIIAGLLGILN